MYSEQTLSYIYPIRLNASLAENMATWEDVLRNASDAAKTRQIAPETRGGLVGIEGSVEVGHDIDMYPWNSGTFLTIEVPQACIQVSDVPVDFIHPHREKLVGNEGRLEVAASQYPACMRLVALLVRVSDIAASAPSRSKEQRSQWLQNSSRAASRGSR